MSGGAFNYLYSKDPLDLSSYKEEIKTMIDTLNELKATKAAKESQELLDLIIESEKQIKEKLNKLEGIWYAVEWFCSGDTTPNQLDQAINEFENGE